VTDVDALADGADRALLDALVGETVLPWDLESRVLAIARGSPLFLRELVRALIAQGRLVQGSTGWRHVPGPVDLPDTVQRVVLARVDTLEPWLRDVLLAAVILRSRFEEDFVADVVDDAVASADVDVSAALAALADLGMVERGSDGWRVAHPLIQETVEANVVRRDRRRLHRRAAEALERRGLVSVAAAALAWHWSEADEPGRAKDPALLAAEYAARRFSYLEAAELQALAVDAARRTGCSAAEIAELGLRLGDLLAAGASFPRAMATYATAADDAVAGSATSVLASLAVAYEDALFASRLERGGVADRSLDLLERAVAELGADASPLAARVHAARARALAYRGDARALDASARALEIARTTGEASSMAYAFVASRAAREGPKWLAERRAHNDEMVAAASRASDGTLLIEVQRLALIDDLQAGDIDRAEPIMTELSDRIGTLRRNDQAWYPSMWRAMQVLWRGELEQAETAIAEFHAVARRVGYEPGHQVHALQLYLLRRRQGRAHELTELFARVRERTGERWTIFDISLAAATGDHRRLNDLIAGVDLAALLPDNLAFTAGAAALCDGLVAAATPRSVALAEVLYARLVPWSGQVAVVGAGAASLGPVDLTLGRLARLLARDDEARAYFEAARDLAVAAHAPHDVEDATSELEQQGP